MQQTVTDPRAGQRQAVAVHILRGRASRASREMTGDELLIGAGVDCDVQMRSPEIAERHCLISRSGRHINLRRLHPEFPVFLNDKGVTASRLQNGDRIRIGPFELKLLVGEAEGVQENDRQESIELDADNFDDKDHVVAASAACALPSRHPNDDSNVERRLRIVAEQLDRIEQQRSELDQLRGKIEQRQAALDRDQKEQSRRTSELTRLESELENRRQQVVELESKIESKRLSLTDESLVLDGAKRSLMEGKEKFFRVRRKAFDFFRTRRSELKEAQERAEGQARELREAFVRFEQERRSWQQLGEQNELTQRELQSRLDELTARFDQVDAERARLANDREQLDREVRELRQKEATLRLYEAELGTKDSALAARETAMADAKDQFQRDVERLHGNAADLEQRARELEAESRRLQSSRQEVERRLQESAALESRLDKSRQDLEGRIAQFDRNSHARTVELELLSQSIKTEQELLRRRTCELEERERRVEGTADGLRCESERLNELAANIARETVAVEDKSKDLEDHARRIAATCESERRTLDSWRGELENEVRLRSQERESFESHRQRWVARFCRVRESACEMAQMRAILVARERKLAADRRTLGERDAVLAEKESQLLHECGKLQCERSQLHLQQTELARKAAAMAAESARLESLARELEGRHAKLFEREQIWRDEVQKKRQDLEAIAARLEKRKLLLDKQAALHSRHLEKIKQVGLETHDKRRQAKSEIEKLIARHEEYRNRLGDERQKQQAVLAEVLSQIERASLRDREADAWLNRVKAENECLVELQAGFAKAIEQMLSRIPRPGFAGIVDAAASTVVMELAPAEVDSWKSAIAACLERLEKFASTLSERETHLLDVRRQETDSRAQLQTLLQSVETAPNFEPPATDPWSMPAIRVDTAFEDEFTSTESTQLAEVIVDDVNSCQIVHRGAVATTYRANLPEFGAPVALRLYLPQWCRDAKLRSIYEAGVKSLAQLSHPGIAKTFRFFAAAESYGVAVEWIAGSPFSKLRVDALDPEIVAGWLDDCLAALAAAHTEGHVHRCLAPGKLMIGVDDRVKIIGFGEPTWLVNLRRCELPKALRIYGAPETQTGGPGDARSDLYSIGRIFGSVLDAAQAKITGAGKTAFQLAGLRAVVEKLSAPTPGKRFATADEALAEVRAASTSSSSRATINLRAARAA